MTVIKHIGHTGRPLHV